MLLFIVSVDCGAPVLALGYTIDSGATTTEGSTVTVTCSVLDGYGGPGVNITCQTDGNWTAISGCFGNYTNFSDNQL